MKILHIDDNNEIIDAFSKILLLKGHEYIGENDGKKGASLILKKNFDLIFLDLTMPGFSGFDVLEEIRSKGYDKSNIILMTAAQLTDSTQERIEKLKVSKILKKPITMKTLFEIVNSEAKDSLTVASN